MSDTTEETLTRCVIHRSKPATGAHLSKLVRTNFQYRCQGLHVHSVSSRQSKGVGVLRKLSHFERAHDVSHICYSWKQFSDELSTTIDTCSEAHSPAHNTCKIEKQSINGKYLCYSHLIVSSSCPTKRVKSVYWFCVLFDFAELDLNSMWCCKSVKSLYHYLWWYFKVHWMWLK